MNRMGAIEAVRGGPASRPAEEEMSWGGNSCVLVKLYIESRAKEPDLPKHREFRVGSPCRGTQRFSDLQLGSIIMGEDSSYMWFEKCDMDN